MLTDIEIFVKFTVFYLGTTATCRNSKLFTLGILGLKSTARKNNHTTFRPKFQ
jgi:hypothetical protein